MNESWVSLQGWVGGEVSRRDAAGVPVASFRLACTPRFVKNGEWVDGTTSWYTINCWRGMADNVVESVHKSEPVVVHGRLRAESWEREGLPPSISYVVDASIVGHDLSKGTSTFTRPSRVEAAQEVVAGAA